MLKFAGKVDWKKIQTNENLNNWRQNVNDNQKKHHVFIGTDFCSLGIDRVTIQMNEHGEVEIFSHKCRFPTNH